MSAEDLRTPSIPPEVGGSVEFAGGFDILWEIKPGPNVAGNLFRREK